MLRTSVHFVTDARRLLVDARLLVTDILLLVDCIIASRARDDLSDATYSLHSRSAKLKRVSDKTREVPWKLQFDSLQTAASHRNEIPSRPAKVIIN